MPHILAACNCLGQTQILDLRKKCMAMRFEARSMDKIQSVSWNPGRKTQLAVSYSKGEAEIWDLRQPKAPKMYLRDAQRGHTRSILDISWNKLDVNLLLTSGDDNLGNIWNGNTGELIHQIVFEHHSKLKVEWNNLRGGLLASMSTEKIALHEVSYLGDDYCPKWLVPNCGVSMGFGGKVVSFGNEYLFMPSNVSSSNLRSSSNGGKSMTPSKVKKTLLIPPNITVGYLPKSKEMIARAESFKRTLNALGTVQEIVSFTDHKLRALESLKDKLSGPSNQQNNQRENEMENQMKSQLKTRDEVSRETTSILDELGITDSEAEEEDIAPEVVEEKMTDSNIGNPQSSGSVMSSKEEIEYEIENWNMIRLFFNEATCKEDIIRYLGFERKEIISKSTSIEALDPIHPKSPSVQQLQSQTRTQTQDQTQSVDQPMSIQNPGPMMEQPSEDDSDDFFDNYSGDEVPSVATPHSVSKPQEIKDQKEESAEQEVKRNDVINQKPKVNSPRSATEVKERFVIPSKSDKQVRDAIITGNYRLAIELSLKAGKTADALVFAHYGQEDDLWGIVAKAYFAEHQQQFIANTFCYIARSDYQALVQQSVELEWSETKWKLIFFCFFQSVFIADFDGFF